MRRTFWHVDMDANYRDRNDRRVVAEGDANCVSSLLEDGRHAPVLDLDVPHTYRESSTPGHGHLLIDVPMTWRQYRRLLKALGRAGILEDGYVRSALSRRHNEARLPHVTRAVPRKAEP